MLRIREVNEFSCYWVIDESVGNGLYITWPVIFSTQASAKEYAKRHGFIIP